MLYRFENYCLDVDRLELRRGAELVSVEPQVFDLLHFLIRNRERVVSKNDLIAGVWNGRAVSDSALTSRVTIARQAIGDSGDEQRLIRTIARKGVRFVGQVNESASGLGVNMSFVAPGAAVQDNSVAAPMKVLVIDDHALIREALHGVLTSLKGEATVLEASNACQGLRSIAENPGVKLILLDLNLPDRDGFEVLAELRERYPAVSVIVLSASEACDDVIKALDLGAMGFIPKSASRDVMLGALNLIFAGGIYVPPQILPPRTPKPPNVTLLRERK